MIILTGAKGFIGQNFLKYLIEHSDEEIVTVDEKDCWDEFPVRQVRRHRHRHLDHESDLLEKLPELQRVVVAMLALLLLRRLLGCLVVLLEVLLVVSDALIAIAAQLWV